MRCTQSQCARLCAMLQLRFAAACAATACNRKRLQRSRYEIAPQVLILAAAMERRMCSGTLCYASARAILFCYGRVRNSIHKNITACHCVVMKLFARLSHKAILTDFLDSDAHNFVRQRCPPHLLPAVPTASIALGFHRY